MSDHLAPTARAAQLRDELFGEDLSATEVAHVLDLDESTVRRRLNDGTLPGYRLGREWRTTEEALRRYVTQLKGHPKPPPPSSITWGAGGTTWGTSSLHHLPSVTHPISSTVTCDAGHDHRDPMDVDEP